MFNRLLPFGLALLVLILASGWFRSCQNEKAKERQIAALDFTVKKTVDKLGRANFELQSLEGDHLDLIHADFAKDTTLVRLQKLVDERGKRANVRAAVSFNATTRGRAVGVASVSAVHTRPEPVPDSLVIRGHVTSKRFDPSQPPTFEADIVATADSVSADPYVVRVGFDVVQNQDGRKVTTTIRPTDPNIVVTSAASFTREEPKKNRGLWAAIGAALVVLLSAL
jgi:hypothetical protein